MLQKYVSIISDVFRGILQVFHMDVAKIYRDVAHVAIVVHVCCKHLFQMLHLLFQTYVASGLFGCCICFTHMLQEYVRNVSAVLVLCCNKCFNVASCKYFIWMLHMFHTHVVSVCFKSLIYFRRMLHSSVSCCL